MTVRLATVSLLTLGLAGCAHGNLEGSDLDRVQHPAFVSRVADEAGPHVTVYRSDSAQAAKLGTTSPETADKKLEDSLRPALSRFEAAERLRSHVHAAIQTEKPWSQSIPPSQVASALETFLVQEVPGSPPDYTRLKPLGADSVVEFVIEEYGVRTEKGVPQTWVKGTGRMFRLDGGELWHTGFSGTSTEAGLKPLDPSGLASDPRPFHEQMVAVLDSVSVQLARQLSPTHRAGGAPTPPGTGELKTPADEQTPLEKEIQKSKSNPPPDATAPTEAPVDVNSSKKKQSKPSAPPPDATSPTEEPVDSKKK